MKSMYPAALFLLAAQLPVPAQVPYWIYSTTGARDNASYSSRFAGRSALTRPHSITVIQVALIPVVATMADGTVLDPTVPSPCTGTPPIDAAIASPVFSNAPFTVNGVEMGNTQYLDAYARANFWQPLSAGNAYHVLLTPVVAQPLRIALTSGTVRHGFCDTGGAAADSAEGVSQSEIRGAVEKAVAGVDRNMVPVFLFHNIAMGTSAGFHGSVQVPNPTTFQIDSLPYAVASWLTAGLYAQVAPTAVALSHEIAEWMMNPFIGNFAPAWHNPEYAGCQSELEVADGLYDAPPIAVRMPNGVDYRLAELSFVSYFYHTTSLGAGGKFSNNGTFTAMAAVCP